MADVWFREVLHKGHVFNRTVINRSISAQLLLSYTLQLPKCESCGSVPHGRPPGATSLRSVLPEKSLLAVNRPHHRGLCEGLKLGGAACTRCKILHLLQKSHSAIITQTFSRKYGRNMAFIARVPGYRAGKMWRSFALHSQMRLKVMAA